MTEEFRTRMIDVLPQLRRFAYLLSGSLDRAEDLTQETCLRALASESQWTSGTRLDSWMYRIAQNLWYDRLRATKVRGTPVEVDEAVQLIGIDGRDVIENRQLLQEVVRNIGLLSAEQQILITLVCVDGLSYQEAAETLHLPIGTVMSRLARARKSLHSEMEREQPKTSSTIRGGRA